MEHGFSTGQWQELAQILSPQMIQSLSILQMSSAELYEYLVREVESNPVISFDSLDRAEKVRRQYKGDFPCFDIPSVPETPVYDATPQTSLRLQLSMLKTSPKVEQLCLQLIGMLDENGYLDRDDLKNYSDIAGYHQDTLNEAIHILQSLEPAGVGAFSLRECILLQLERKGLSGSDAWVIACDYLDLLGKNNLPQIAKRSGIPLHRVINAKELIRTLNPRPLMPEARSSDIEYIIPDIRIRKAGKGMVVELNQISADNIVIDETYSRIYRETDSESVRSFLNDNLKTAQLLRENLRQRCETLMDCATALLRHQRLFFEYGPTALKPYNRREMAEELGRSESTISRAFKNKYVECDWGMFPADYFFPKQTADDCPDIPRTVIVNAISEIIKHEDSRHPLSDEAIAGKLEENGIALSRRTVAKYRDELGIPASSQRKMF